MAPHRRLKRKDNDDVIVEQSMKSNQGVTVSCDKSATDKSDTTNSNSKDSQSSRKPRGRTQLDRLSVQRVQGIKKDVEFNTHGQPVGKVAAEMQSYIGILTRENVKITHKTWKQVPRDVKELIWKSVNLTYNVDPKWKKECLASANSKWRQWKSMLTKKFIKKRISDPELLNIPPYDEHVQPDEWSSFVISRMSEDFVKLSEQQSDRRKKNLYPYRLSRQGYAGLAEEIKHELSGDDKVDRAILWKRARMDKKGEFASVDLKQTVEKIDDYIDQREKGILKFKGPAEDVLTMTLQTKEHHRRVRGVGGNIPPRVYFNCTRGRKHVNECFMIDQQKELVEAKKKLSEQGARIDQLEALLNKIITCSAENIVEKGSCSVRLQHSKEDAEDAYDDEVGLLDKSNSLQGRLVSLTLESTNDIAAYGTVVAVNGHDSKLHGASFPENCMSVSIDEAVDKSAPLPIPIPNECESIGDAVGSHVAWPTHLVMMRNEKPTRKNIDDQEKRPAMSVPRALHMLYWYCKRALHDGETIIVSLDDDVFGHKCIVYVDLQNITPFCALEPITGTCIVVYIWHLYKKLKEENKVGRFRFVHPSGISHVPTQNEDESFKVEQLKKRAQCLADRLIDASTDQLVLVPCNIGFHWILTIIDPYKEVVSIMDPLNHRIRDNDWKIVVNLALQLFNANNKRKGKKQPTWEIVQGPRQPDAKQCGFYVMLYLRQITGVTTINHASLKSMFTKGEYSQTQIDEMRSEWAECVQEYI